MTDAGPSGGIDRGSVDTGTGDRVEPGTSPEAATPNRVSPDRVAPEAGARAELLRSYGVDESVIAIADQNHHLTLLLMETVARPGDTDYDLDDVAVATGLSPELITRMWRSLGLTVPRVGDRAFNDSDVALLAVIGQLMESDVIDHDLTLQMARVVGSSMSRVANAVVDAVDPGDDLRFADGEGAELSDGVGLGDGDGDGDRSETEGQAETDSRVAGHPRSEASEPQPPPRGEAFAAVAPVLVPNLIEIMGLVWRRHLQDAARARMAREQAATDPSHMVVGFADLVGFTALSQQLGPHELAEVVERFETRAYDTVGRLGGRVVKMIGDEVLFAVPHERAAAEIALSLAEGYAADDDLPDVRVGLASGPVLQREADVFGPVVNLAGRLVTLAFPATVVCTAEVRDALEGDVEFAWRDIGNRKVKDIGRIPLYVLRRADAAEVPRSSRERAGARWAERQEARMAEMEARRPPRRR